MSSLCAKILLMSPRALGFSAAVRRIWALNVDRLDLSSSMSSTNVIVVWCQARKGMIFLLTFPDL